MKYSKEKLEKQEQIDRKRGSLPRQGESEEEWMKRREAESEETYGKAADIRNKTAIKVAKDILSLDSSEEVLRKFRLAVIAEEEIMEKVRAASAPDKARLLNESFWVYISSTAVKVLDERGELARLEPLLTDEVKTVRERAAVFFRK